MTPAQARLLLLARNWAAACRALRANRAALFANRPPAQWDTRQRALWRTVVACLWTARRELRQRNADAAESALRHAGDAMWQLLYDARRPDSTQQQRQRARTRWDQRAKRESTDCDAARALVEQWKQATKGVTRADAIARLQLIEPFGGYSVTKLNRWIAEILPPRRGRRRKLRNTR